MSIINTYRERCACGAEYETSVEVDPSVTNETIEYVEPREMHEWRTRHERRCRLMLRGKA